MIEIKLKEIVNNINALKKLSEGSFNGKVAFQIARLLKKVETEIEIFNTSRMTLLKKYGEKDEDGELKVDGNNNYVIKKEYRQNFVEELNEMLESSIKINVEKIDYKDIEKIEFTPSEAMALEEFVNFD